jgi:hypothetical protein
MRYGVKEEESEEKISDVGSKKISAMSFKGSPNVSIKKL